MRKRLNEQRDERYYQLRDCEEGLMIILVIIVIGGVMIGTVIGFLKCLL